MGDWRETIEADIVATGLLCVAFELGLFIRVDSIAFKLKKLTQQKWSPVRSFTNGRNDDHSTDNEEREPELADKCRMLWCLLEPPFDKVPRHSRGELVRYLTIVRQELNLLALFEWFNKKTMETVYRA